MTFALEDLRRSKCPNMWHSLLEAGRLENGQVVVDDDSARRILARCYDPPQVQHHIVTFDARLRSDASKAVLRAICGVCEHNQDGQCRAASCCGGRVPVEVRMNLTTTTCPKGKWPAN